MNFALLYRYRLVGGYVPLAKSTQRNQDRGQENDRLGRLRTGAGQLSIKETLTRHPLDGQ
jgi:hypothetical protein